MNNSPNLPIIDTILVPQGAEYQAVSRGLRHIEANKPQILAIPIGSQGLVSYLMQWQQSQDFLDKQPKNILLMGLGGSLAKAYDIGQVVLYQQCSQIEQKTSLFCDPHLTHLIDGLLQQKAAKVKGLTSDRVICYTQEKSRLGQMYDAQVVDMEGYTILKLQNLGIRIAIVRVISDSVQQTLPDLTTAISLDGSLKPLPLASAMLKHPLGSMQLIQGALKGLKVLQQVTYQLFLPLNHSN